MSKRSDILTATHALLWDRGYEATSPRAVMEHSGAGQGSLYHHFSDKKQLALTVLQEIEAQLTAELDGTLGDRARSPLERILAWLDLPRESLKGCRLGRLAFERSVIDEAALRAPISRYFQQLERRLHQTLLEAVNANELPEKLAEAGLASLLVTTVQGGYLLSRVHQDPRKLTDATRSARTLLLFAAGNGQA